LTVEPSPRFRRLLPRLHQVPNFQGVLIHTGNKVTETEGCILVGAAWQKGAETIQQSRVALYALFAKLNDALARGEPLVVQERAPADLLARAVRPMRGVAKPKAKPKPKRKAAKPKTAAKRKAAPKKKRAARRR